MVIQGILLGSGSTLTLTFPFRRHDDRDPGIDQVVDPTVVIFVVVRRYEMVDLGYTRGLHHSLEAGSVIVLATVH